MNFIIYCIINFHEIDCLFLICNSKAQLESISSALQAMAMTFDMSLRKQQIRGGKFNDVMYADKCIRKMHEYYTHPEYQAGAMLRSLEPSIGFTVLSIYETSGQLDEPTFFKAYSQHDCDLTTKLYNALKKELCAKYPNFVPEAL